MELCPGSLKEVIVHSRMKKKNFSLITKITILLQLASAIAYLHKKINRAHGNIHPSNVLLSSTLTPLLTDTFLIATEKRLLKKQVASNFIAPEIKGDSVPSMESDIYSFGCLILYVLTDGEREVTANMDYSFLENQGLELMIKRCCYTNPAVLFSCLP